MAPVTIQRVIDAAARAACEAAIGAEIPNWPDLDEGVKVMWRRAVLAAVGVVDKQITSVTVSTKVRHYHQTEELEGLLEVMEREVR